MTVVLVPPVLLVLLGVRIDPMVLVVIMVMSVATMVGVSGNDLMLNELLKASTVMVFVVSRVRVGVLQNALGF